MKSEKLGSCDDCKHNINEDCELAAKCNMQTNSLFEKRVVANSITNILEKIATDYAKQATIAFKVDEKLCFNIFLDGLKTGFSLNNKKS